MDPVTMAMVGGSLLSGIGGMIGGNQRAGAASQAANQSAIWQLLGQQNAQQMLQKAQGFLQPYTEAGNTTIGLLTKYLQGTGAQDASVGGGGANLLSTFAPTQAQLEQTPGYQFTLSQGTKAAQNAAAGRGLGSSGNAMQAGVDYATGLAGTTFQQQLQNYMNQNLQAYNMLMGPSQLGGQAAGTLAQGAMNLGGQLLGGMTNVGNTLGAGIMGGANATAQGTQSLFSGLGQGATTAAMMPLINQLYGGAGQPRNPYGQVGPSDLWNFASGQSSPFPSQGYNTNYAGGAR